MTSSLAYFCYPGAHASELQEAFESSVEGSKESSGVALELQGATECSSVANYIEHVYIWKYIAICFNHGNIRKSNEILMVLKFF